MATSVVEICNLALDNIGSKPIVSFDEETNSARLCQRWYDIARRTTLKDSNASFAIKRDVLSEVADFKPVYGYSNAFALPKDYLNILNIENPMNLERYQIENNRLYCDYKEKVFIRYIYDCTEVNLYDDDFKEALALKLASCICMPLTQSAEKTLNLKQLYKKQFLETTNKYGNDNKMIIVTKPRYRQAKMQYGGDIVR